MELSLPNTFRLVYSNKMVWRKTWLKENVIYIHKMLYIHIRIFIYNIIYYIYIYTYIYTYIYIYIYSYIYIYVISCKIISDAISFFCLSKHKEVFRLSLSLLNFFIFEGFYGWTLKKASDNKKKLWKPSWNQKVRYFLLNCHGKHHFEVFGE